MWRHMRHNDPLSPDSDAWLSLKTAAARLNVHFATLRRWADQGDIPHMLTPGGHRRFAAAAISAFAEQRMVSGKALSVPEAWASQAMQRTRAGIPAQANAQWMVSLSDDLREKHRQVGRRLMGLTLQYLSAEEGSASEHLLHEARDVGREYGQISHSSGILLSDALQAALFFRDRLMEASLDLPETTRPRSIDQSRLLMRINALLNAVQLAIASVYEQTPMPNSSTSTATSTSTTDSPVAITINRSRKQA